MSVNFPLGSDFTGKLYAFYERRDHAVQIARGQPNFLIPASHRDLMVAYNAALEAEAEQDSNWLEAELARAAIDDQLMRLGRLREAIAAAGTDEARGKLLEEARAVAGQIRELRAALDE